MELRPYLTPKGIDIQIADLPTGTHKVGFSIKDTKEHLTERTLKLTIADASQQSFKLPSDLYSNYHAFPIVTG